jgi:type IV pilus assembly protein PilW
MTAHHRQHGFSLVELAIAAAISLAVLAAIGRVCIATGHSYRLQDSLARLQETARHVLGVLDTDLRRTGYWGGINAVQRIEDVTPAGLARGRRVTRDDGTCTGAPWALMLGYRVFGLDDTRRGYPCLSGGRQPQGDVLVVRYLAPWPVGGATTPAFRPQHYYLRGSAFEGRLFRGADQASQPVTGTPVYTGEVVARAYYIRTVPGSRCEQPGMVPSLYRTSLADGRLVAGEIARGVEQLQVRYGIDGDDDGSVDDFVDAPPAADSQAWHHVRAVRFWVLLRSECPETGQHDRTTYRPGNIRLSPADGYRRALYVHTVQLRNPGLQP